MNVQRVVTIGLTAALVGASAGLHVSANPARGLPAAHRDIAAHIDAYEAKIAGSQFASLCRTGSHGCD